MDLGSGYPLHYDYLESSGTPIHNNMYSQFNSMGTPLSKEKSTDNNLRMFSTKQSLSVDNVLMNQPKKETLVRSLFRSASNLFSERLARLGTSSIIRNLYNMNNPQLSVTVVSQDFFKSLQNEKSQLVNPGFENVDISKSWIDDDESRTNEDTLSQILFSNDYSSEPVSSGDADTIWEKYKKMYIDPHKMNNTNSIEKYEKVTGNLSSSKNEVSETSLNSVVDDQTVLDTSPNFGNILEVDHKSAMLKEISKLNKEQQSKHLNSQELKSMMEEEEASSKKNTPGSMYNVNKKHSRNLNDSMEADSSVLFTKRACSPRPRPKKSQNVSSGRRQDKGFLKTRRAKSGSKIKKSRGYYKHSKKTKRRKYDNSEDIKNDLSNWEELEYIIDSAEDEEECNDQTKVVDVIDFQKEMSPTVDEDDSQLKRTWWIAFGNNNPVKKRVFKNLEKNKKKNEWTNVSSHLVVPTIYNGCEVETMEELSFRPRLSSENSDTSECSFSIEFVTECDDSSESDDCSDSDDNMESDDSSESESESDDEDYVVFSSDMETEDKEVSNDSDEDMPSVDCTDCVKLPEKNQPLQSNKVRFNDKPKVHHILHWRYAHQAARLNQSQKALDRFRAMIPMKLVNIISPVLDEKHRKRIYLERFADQETQN